MTDPKLEPCPFCGENCADLIVNQGTKWAHYEPACLEVRAGYDMAEDAAWRVEAIAAWNRRATPQPEGLEALETILEMLAGHAGQPTHFGDIFKIADAAIAKARGDAS